MMILGYEIPDIVIGMIGTLGFVLFILSLRRFMDRRQRMTPTDEKQSVEPEQDAEKPTGVQKWAIKNMLQKMQKKTDEAKKDKAMLREKEARMKLLESTKGLMQEYAIENEDGSTITAEELEAMPTQDLIEIHQVFIQEIADRFEIKL